jgi:amicyanin
MKNKAPLIIVAVVVLGAIGAIVYGASRHKDAPHMHSSDNGSSTADTNSAVETNMVTIENFKFSPSTITVKKGTTVTWTNNDSVKHNIVGDNLDVLKGPLLEKGKTYTYTFTAAGTFMYHCDPHPYMKGTVVVTE